MGIKIHGELPDYIVQSLSRDKVGVFAGKTFRYFQVGSKNQRIDLSWLDPKTAPQPWSLPCTEVSSEILMNGMLKVVYSYEGIDSGREPSDDEIEFEMDTSMAEEGIETHPQFANLAKAYGWDADEKQFAATTAPAATDGTNALSSTTAKSTGSPMRGVDSWLVVGAIFRRTYAATRIPESALQGIGAIVRRPPDIGAFSLPSDMKKRNWLKLAPKLRRRGNAANVSEEWMLSGPKGWLTPIYSQAQLGE